MLWMIALSGYQKNFGFETRKLLATVAFGLSKRNRFPAAQPRKNVATVEGAVAQH